MSKRYVSTTQFENTHGRKPRGYGRWGFYINGLRYFTTAHYRKALRLATDQYRREYGDRPLDIEVMA